MIKNILNKTKMVLLIVLAGLAACLIVIYGIVRRTSLQDFDRSSAWFLEKTKESLDSRGEMLEKINLYGNYMNYDLIYNISYLFDNCDYKTLTKEELEKKNEEVQKKADDYDVDHLFVIDGDGTVYISIEGWYEGKNLVEEQILTSSELAKVIEGDIFERDEEWQGGIAGPTGVKEENLVYAKLDGVTCVFNSCPIYAHDTDILGTYYAVSATRDVVYEQAETILMDLSLAFDTVVPYDTFAAIMIDGKTGLVTQASPVVSELYGKTMQELGIGELDTLTDGNSHKLSIGGKKYLAYVGRYDRKDVSPEVSYYIVTLKGADYTASKYLWLTVALFFVSGLFLFSEAAACRGSGRKEIRRRLSAVVLVLLLLNTAVGTYVWTMYSISGAMEQCTVNASAIGEHYSRMETLLEEVERYYKDKKIAVLGAMAGYLENMDKSCLSEEYSQETNVYYDMDAEGSRTPALDSLGNTARSFSGNMALDVLKEEQEMNTLLIMDQNGRTVASSGNEWYYELESAGTEEDISTLRMVLDQKIRGACLLMDSDSKNETRQIVAVPMNLYASGQDGTTVYHSKKEYEQDQTGNIRKLDCLLIEDSDMDSDLILSRELVGELMTSSLSGYLDAVISVASWDENAGRALLSYGLDSFTQEDLDLLEFRDLDFTDDNYKFTWCNGDNVFAGIVEMQGGSESLITLLKTSDVLYGFLSAFFSIAGAFFLYVGILALILAHREPENPEKIKIQDQRQQIREERLDWKAISMDASVRSVLLAKAVLVAITAYILIEILISTGSSSDNRSLSYALSQRWEKGVHIFSLSVTIYLMLFLYVANSLIRGVFSTVSSAFSSRVKTMVRLLISILQYGSILAIIGYSLYLFGVETGTVITSASILTAIIGFGSQSLIADVVAGIFIIIEREYMVGDVVTIGDFTGVVKEIGLRTTKLVDNCGNTKIFNNSAVSGVMNLTENYSQCFVTFSVRQQVPVEKIEELVDGELYQEMCGDPMIVEGPWFSGIMKMSGGCYTVSIAARCLQEDVWKVQKEMYERMMRLLNRDEIETQ